MIPRPGGVWATATRGIVPVDDDGTVGPIAGDNAYRFATTVTGSIAGTAGGLLRLVGNNWIPVDGVTGEVRDLRVRADGTVWLAGTGLRRWDPQTGRIVESLSTEDGLPDAMIDAIDLADDGTLWMASDRGLVERHPDGAVERFGTEQGLPDSIVTFVTHDPRDGTVWVGTNHGVAARIGGSWRIYDHRSGLPSDETNQRAARWDGDSLWIGTSRGWGIFDTAPPLPNTVPPTVRLGAWTDDAAVAEGADLPPDGRTVRFEIAAISLSVPDRVTVRYRLAGVEDWTPTDARTIRYPALSPGEYGFEVIACNEDGVCSDPARFGFTVVPAWWETAPFRAGVAVSALIGVAGVASGLQWRRAAALRADNERLERVVGERTRDLAVEKDKSDRLLRDILPDTVVAELKNHGAATSRRYDDVTILFTDLQGFTKIAGEQPPERIVAELNEVFAAFDDICRRNNLEKLKTIGDAYMAAGGIPVANATHPIDAVRAAIAMQAYINARVAADKLPFRVRIGLHTGPVVAGVIGTWKFAYDIWGDAVNIAARMESSGEAGEINLSEATWARVRDAIPCVARGKVYAKGKGEMEMYFVARAAP